MHSLVGPRLPQNPKYDAKHGQRTLLVLVLPLNINSAQRSGFWNTADFAGVFVDNSRTGYYAETDL